MVLVSDGQGVKRERPFEERSPEACDLNFGFEDHLKAVFHDPFDEFVFKEDVKEDKSSEDQAEKKKFPGPDTPTCTFDGFIQFYDPFELRRGDLLFQGKRAFLIACEESRGEILVPGKLKMAQDLFLQSFGGVYGCPERGDFLFHLASLADTARQA